MCIYDADVKTTWGVYSTQLLVENMLNWAITDLRPKLARHLAHVRRTGPYKALETTFPETPTRATFALDCIPTTAPAAGRSDQNGLSFGAMSSTRQSLPATAAPGRQRLDQVHERLNNMSLNDPEDAYSNDSDGADSGVGGMLSDVEEEEGRAVGESRQVPEDGQSTTSQNPIRALDDRREKLYCFCRGRYTGSFMIGCDGPCNDWFHGKCIGMSSRTGELIDEYFCSRCTKAGAGRTTWKRKHRRSYHR